MICCILLSAGFSRRFGSPKALAPLPSGKVIEHIIATLLASSVDVICVVLGADADKIKPFILNHKKVYIVYNKDYKFGQTSSFQSGLRHCPPSCRGVFLCPVDYPFIKKETFDQMTAYFNTHHPLLLLPVYNEKRGHPPLFNAELFPDFLALKAEMGCHEVVRKQSENVSLLPVDDPGILQTFNTLEEFKALK